MVGSDCSSTGSPLFNTTTARNSYTYIMETIEQLYDLLINLEIIAEVTIKILSCASCARQWSMGKSLWFIYQLLNNKLMDKRTLYQSLSNQLYV